MKRSFFFLLIISIVPLTAFSQTTQESFKYWIFLKDKVDQSGYKTPVEPEHITSAALSRRSLRATRDLTDYDRPVSQNYLDQLIEADISPLVQSRWLNAVSAYLREDDIQRVSALPFVTEVRRVARMDPVSMPEPSVVTEALPAPDIRKNYRLDYGPSIFQLELVNSIPLLEEGRNASGVKLGIIDTGMGSLVSSHPATSQMVADNRFIESRDFTGQPADQSVHGYAVLSVAAGFDPGRLIGPAYGAEIYHARTEYAPTETNQEEDSFVAGIEWMESEGVDVINISLGYSEFDNGQSSYSVSDLDGETGITTRAADIAAEMGVVVVSSAGNSGCNSPSSCWYFITMPADGHNVITVGAVDSLGVLANFSSRGPTADDRIKPDVVAQGVASYLAIGNLSYSRSSGTSFSSPMVAGVVALMLEANPSLRPDQVRDILRSTASQAIAPDNEIGWGRIDADAAVQTALALVSSTENDVPFSVAVQPPYPNPTFDRTNIWVDNDATPIEASIEVYNLLGQRIQTSYSGVLQRGRHRVSIDLSNQPAGLYIYRFEAGDLLQSGTFVKL